MRRSYLYEPVQRRKRRNRCDGTRRGWTKTTAEADTTPTFESLHISPTKKTRILVLSPTHIYLQTTGPNLNFMCITGCPQLSKFFIFYRFKSRISPTPPPQTNTRLLSSLKTTNTFILYALSLTSIFVYCWLPVPFKNSSFLLLMPRRRAGSRLHRASERQTTLVIAGRCCKLSSDPTSVLTR
jgi:hypothetical protein